MLKLVVISACLVAVLGQYKFNDESELQMEYPTVAGCCTPDQWEGYQGIIGGYARFIKKGAVYGYTKVSYDAKNERIAAVANMTRDGKNHAIRVIEDYQNGKIYIISLKKNWCKTLTTKRSFKKACVPKSAVKIGEFYQGTGLRKLTQVAYYYEHKSFFNVVRSTFDLTKKGCIPTNEVISGRVKGVNFMDVVGFSDITAGIKDPAVFNPPESCNKTESDSGPNFELHEHMLYREFRYFGL
ncbi:hypothetical protein LOTGIDRAFT_233583 [Lottia gigantea]|uniref:Uncharacterized protein n=1 Tax=Lottia gigantea TaxID=225164 RepID=V4BP88_LOTGI|nr:hypothetical protein LOTGIDRAFT_233583 [Lottia gigantea]ESO90789.1 hypothetical protein LOTGIDRAFT_233583 [Lottia gigantea]